MTEKIQIRSEEIKNVPMLISNVMKDLSEVGIAKAQENKFDNYKFRGIDDVYNTLSKILAKHNLVITPSIVNRELGVVTTAKGGSMNHTVLTVEYTFSSPYSDDKVTCVMMGEAMDRGDKSINKAFSAAYKYLCLQVFCIPLQGDNDADSESHETIVTKINDYQLNTLQNMIMEAGIGEEPILTLCNVDKIENIPSELFVKVKNKLDVTIAKKLAEKHNDTNTEILAAG